MNAKPYPFAERAQQYARFTPADLEAALVDAQRSVAAFRNDELEGFYLDDCSTIRQALAACRPCPTCHRPI